jgi:hypothetical protein
MQRLPLRVAVFGLALISCLLIAITVVPGSQVSHGPVYTVARVHAGLAHHPDAWVGRTVWVRGVAWYCLGWAYGPCLVRSPLLSDPGVDGGLAFASPPANSLLALVRAMPLVGRLLPPRQAPRWGVLAAYRVQIHAVPLVSCSYWPCYEVVLLDVTQ